MASIKEVRERIKSVNSTQQITKAMKMVAAAKLKRAQDAIMQMRPYADKLNVILGNVTESLKSTNVVNDYFVERDVVNVLLVVVTSDRGLCGAFNSSVFKGAHALLDEKYAGLDYSKNLTILPIGKKSLEYFQKRGFNVVDKYSTIFTELSFASVSKAADYSMKSFLNGKYDVVEIVYNEFVNVATQNICKDQFLPQLGTISSVDSSSDVDYIYEPSTVELLNDLVPTSLKIKFFKAVLESNASEHGARMTAMDKATDNAGELLKELKLQYNRSRQAAITTEILEIVGGAEALSNG
jgi:F-type H+-transporting ATPase subunit gamma